MRIIYNDLPRHKWKRYRRRSTSVIRSVTLHHSATHGGSPEAFARYHVERLGWPGIAYHYVIQPSGETFKTGPITTVRYHAKGVNSQSIGLCLTGWFDAVAPPPDQWSAALDLCALLQRAFHGLVVQGHREVRGTRKSCPGWSFDLDRFRRELSAR